MSNTVSAAAAGLPSEREILGASREWLEIEAMTLGRELYPELGDKAHRFVPANTAAANFHFPLTEGAIDPPPPSARAKLILQTIGVLPKDAPVPAEESPLDALIAGYRATQAKYSELLEVLDSLAKDDPRRGALEEETKRLCDAEFAAVDEICAYRVQTLEEARTKAACLAQHFKHFATEDVQMQALLRSFLV